MVKSRKLQLSAMVTAVILLHSGHTSAQAATATGVMTVSATVLSFCTIAALPLAFGNYTSVLITAISSVTVSCTSGTSYNVGLDAGIGGVAATVASRLMSFGTNKLAYQITSDAAHATQWGPTIGTNTVTGVGTGLPQVLPVYGQIAAGQLSAPGAYLDTVTATITY